MPKQIKQNGLKDSELKISDPALLDIVRHYTREAGVRNLEREIAKISRKAVKQLLLDKAGKRRAASVTVTPRNLDKFLGVRRFRFGKAEEINRVGQVTGLAWTEVGGELLTIEAAVVPGKGKLLHTGQLGEVMQESIQAAMSVVRSRAAVLGLEPDFYQKHDVHIHMPEGATPKDGPSAGIGMCTALVSALTRIPVRSDVAMTGEITLRGEVLPIGGLKEKLLAAQRGGIAMVDPGGEPEGPGRDSGQHQGQARDQAGALDRRGAADGADAPADTPGGRCCSGRAGQAGTAPAGPRQEPGTGALTH